MQIIDLNDEYKKSYFVCLEDWSEEMKEAGNHKEKWFRDMSGKGLGVKIALNDEEKAVGMIQYIPIEYSFAEGKNLFIVLCIWVHGYKGKGVGNQQKQGIGKALLNAAEEDVRNRGAKGMVTWGLSIPVFMRASWFKKQGYEVVEKDGFLGQVLLWKKFCDDAEPPKWLKVKRIPSADSEKVTVTCFISGWCPAYNRTIERAKKASSELVDNVECLEVNTVDKKTKDEWGLTDALFIQGKKLNTGPPPSYKKIKKKIEKAVKKIS